MIRVVLDSNVLVAAALWENGSPARVLDHILADEKFALVLSDFILDETRHVLLRPKLTKYFTKIPDREAFVAEFIGRLDRFRVPVHEESVVDMIPNDPSDNRVLACALDGAAHILVTGNDHHFGQLGIWEGIDILTPRAFLEKYLNASFQ
ncbi:MAG: putative toxin-antitoxin system toxin component, PIN family [Candidatus Kerfeldbacteria bacterium]|nr:putative toxin-antitoxin system toxin component, PIN family [Candidatus Kerfeldbacteria bacterium]